MDNDLIIEKNKKWKSKPEPFLTVMTPVYNRRSTIRRAIDSVEKQTFRNIEYIIIDDGSSESIDDIVQEYMHSTKLPVMFVKKANGGVHTARNIGYQQARGELVLCIDSDDELLPEACEVFHKTWLSIPEEKRAKYWQIKAQCIDQNGIIAGSLFPKNINQMSSSDSKRYFSMARGEQIGCRVVDIMKKNLFPEPLGITFVAENIRWIPLESKYRSWGINDVVRVYHKEGEDHLSTKNRKKTKQQLKNLIWNIAYQLNNQQIFNYGFMMRFKLVAQYDVYMSFYEKTGDDTFICENKLKGLFNRFWGLFLWLPARIIAFRYNN